MCGIFAYSGSRPASNIIFNGLKKLEYRGYDSWGIAVGGDTISIHKLTGKLPRIAPKTNSVSTIAIGHTRWATHGGVTVNNSHPHTDCTGSVVVVHNGIIENFESLKDDLLARGHTFRSETDTEVFAHLVEDYLKTSDNLTSAVKRSFKKITGLNTIVVLRGKEIVAFKNGSPLVAGIDKEGAMYLSSDIPALLSRTNDISIIEDMEGIQISDNLYSLSLSSNKKSLAKTTRVNMKEERSTLGKHKYFLEKEICEQPGVIKHVAGTKNEVVTRLASLIKSSYGTYFTACGTAAYAGLAATYLFADIASRHINFTVASEFSHFRKFLTKRSLLIAASQSGETMDTLEAVRAAQGRGSKIVSFVNVPSSTLARISDETFLLEAGPERAVLSTKAYSAKLSTFFLLAYEMAGLLKEGKSLLMKTSRLASELLLPRSRKNIRAIARSISKHEHIYLIGRGTNYPTALEGALKIKESSYIHAEGFAGGELKHGVIALIEKGTPCIVIVAKDESESDTLSSAMEMKARGAHIIGVGPVESTVFDDWIEVPDVGPASPILNVIPLQLLGYELTLIKGYDPDKPRNLAKSVTVK